MLPVLPDLEVTPLALTPRPSRDSVVSGCTGIGTIWQGFLRDPAVSRLLIKLTGSDQNPLSFATVLLARYDIDGNKVFEKVGLGVRECTGTGSRRSTPGPSVA